MSPLAQPVLHGEQARRDNASIDGVFIVKPLVEGLRDWLTPVFGTQEPIGLEQVEYRVYDLAASPGLFIEQAAPAYTSGSVPFTFGACLTTRVEIEMTVHYVARPSETLPTEPEVARLYVWRNPTEVDRFLQDHSHLIDVLSDAHPHLMEHFPDSKIELEVIRDPGIGKEGELFAYIPTSLSVEAAQAQLDSFDEEWFLDQLDLVEGLLNFNLEFV